MHPYLISQDFACGFLQSNHIVCFLSLTGGELSHRRFEFGYLRAHANNTRGD